MSNWLEPWGWVEIYTFASVTGLMAVALYLLTQRKPRLQRRVDDLSEDLRGGDASATGAGTAATTSRFGFCLLPRDFAVRARLQERLIKAGIDHPAAPSVFMAVRLTLPALCVTAGLVAGLYGVAAMERALFCGLLAAGFGMLLPSFWIDRRRGRRQLSIGRALPDFLDLLVTCLESGLSLDASLRRVTAELRVAHPLLALEMGRVQSEIDLGATADAALRNLGDRCDLESITTLGMFVQQAQRFGIGIAEALRGHAETLREQREQRAEDLAQKAAVKILFPTLLLIFPAVFVVLAGPAAIKLNEKFSQNSPQSIENTSASPGANDEA